MMRISEWLSELDSHDVCNSQQAAADFKEKTGFAADWPEHTRRATLHAMEERGVGGWVSEGDSETMMSNVWEMAEALARKYAGFGGSIYYGRGKQFRAAIVALEEKGL